MRTSWGISAVLLLACGAGRRKFGVAQGATHGDAVCAGCYIASTLATAAAKCFTAKTKVRINLVNPNSSRKELPSKRSTSMTNPFGPCATSIQIGSHPQLIAFWKDRIRLLASVGKTSPAISRRGLLQLGAAGVLARGDCVPRQNGRCGRIRRNGRGYEAPRGVGDDER